MTLFNPTTVDSAQAMTRSPLFQEDVFHCVLDSLAPREASPKQFRESRRVFVSLAQTCRAFSELSLNRLWSRLDSLEPLIRCFATVLNEERAKTPPSPAEWDVVRRYSHRIRELSIGSHSRCSLLFLRSIGSHHPPLVPNLRVLKWRAKTRPFKFVQRLLGPSLVSLDVALSDADDATLQSFIADCPFLCPNLKSIVINVAKREAVSSTTIGTLSRVIPHHEHLESLDVSVPINDVALTHVATSPMFKKLSLVLHPDKSNLHQARIPSNVTPFRNVEDLSLEVWDLYFVVTLLRTRDQSFRSFALRHHFSPTTSATRVLLTALASSQRMRSLQSITLMPATPDRADVETLHGSAVDAHDEMSDYLTCDTLLPLASLVHLRELVIDLDRWFSIDDNDLASLSRHWPSLRVLHLGRRHAHGRPGRSAKYVTLQGLLSLLGRCPDLYDFRLPVHAREVLVDAGKSIGDAALTYVHSPSAPGVVLVCGKKARIDASCLP